MTYSNNEQSGTCLTSYEMLLSRNNNSLDSKNRTKKMLQRKQITADKFENNMLKRKDYVFY